MFVDKKCVLSVPSFLFSIYGKLAFLQQLHTLHLSPQERSSEGKYLFFYQAMASLTTSTPIALSKPFESLKSQPIKAPCATFAWKPPAVGLRLNRGVLVRPVSAAPDKIEDKVVESIKQAEEACAGDPVSGECVAAWDEVEELSAAASHARDKQKGADPLETFCKDNPETEECRTYDN
ncbi:hypothetical protein MLD38_021679 [Melastoma candidum]|uniref:Uncharacterized protein n=1 Tax=Melastoma candidum TaxID=119954 RepID=A0ACB9QH25_9MYRT|nr:hypothetical protein MLD38_021679 [Melastoma candidum]